MTLEIIELTAHDPETFDQCPVCHTVFEQPARGRRRVYCSSACKNIEFRRVQSATKLTSAARSELVKQQMAVGDWCFTTLPEWPRYRCLACGQLLPHPSPRPLSAVEGAGVVEGHYDWNDYNQIAGVYRRVICATCAPSSPSSPLPQGEGPGVRA